MSSAITADVGGNHRADGRGDDKMLDALQGLGALVSQVTGAYDACLDTAPAFFVRSETEAPSQDDTGLSHFLAAVKAFGAKKDAHLMHMARKQRKEALLDTRKKARQVYDLDQLEETLGGNPGKLASTLVLKESLHGIQDICQCLAIPTHLSASNAPSEPTSSASKDMDTLEDMTADLWTSVKACLMSLWTRHLTPQIEANMKTLKACPPPFRDPAWRDAPEGSYVCHWLSYLYPDADAPHDTVPTMSAWRARRPLTGGASTDADTTAATRTALRTWHHTVTLARLAHRLQALLDRHVRPAAPPVDTLLSGLRDALSASHLTPALQAFYTHACATHAPADDATGARHGAAVAGMLVALLSAWRDVFPDATCRRLTDWLTHGILPALTSASERGVLLALLRDVLVLYGLYAPSQAARGDRVSGAGVQGWSSCLGALGETLPRSIAQRVVAMLVQPDGALHVGDATFARAGGDEAVPSVLQAYLVLALLQARVAPTLSPPSKGFWREVGEVFQAYPDHTRQLCGTLDAAVVDAIATVLPQIKSRRAED